MESGSARDNLQLLPCLGMPLYLPNRGKKSFIQAGQCQAIFISAWPAVDDGTVPVCSVKAPFLQSKEKLPLFGVVHYYFGWCRASAYVINAHWSIESCVDLNAVLPRPLFLP
jgi:hypothetical protein